MNFLIYDEQGRILQSNKVYDSTGYGDLLNSKGMKFVGVNSAVPLSMDDYFVSKGLLTARPDMPYFVSKGVFKADGSDAAVITGLPKPCRVTVTVTGGIKLAENEECTLGYVEVVSAVPAIYEVLIEAFPYRPKTFVLRAEE